MALRLLVWADSQPSGLGVAPRLTPEGQELEPLAVRVADRGRVLHDLVDDDLRRKRGGKQKDGEHGRGERAGKTECR